MKTTAHARLEQHAIYATDNAWIHSLERLPPQFPHHLHHSLQNLTCQTLRLRHQPRFPELRIETRD